MHSASRIKRNRNIAIMRLSNNKNPTIKGIWLEHFWPPEQWPDHIVNSFMDFKYTDRICVCNFFYGNGLIFDNAFAAIRFYHSWNTSELRHYEYQFRLLWLRVDNAVKHIHDDWHRITSTYYFYSMMSRSVMYFDGTLRMYGNKINILNNQNISNPIALPHCQSLTRTFVTNGADKIDSNRGRAERLERRWKFLASIDRDPIIIDGHIFKFDAKLYTNTL